MQFVKLELIKLYKNRLRYGDDWQNIVIATIRRRVGDFRVKMLRQNERFLSENRISQDDDGYKVADHKVQEPNIGETTDTLIAIGKIVESDKRFNSWDKEVLAEMCNMYRQGQPLADLNIMYAMGYLDEEANEFHRKMREFRQKIRTIGSAL